MPLPSYTRIWVHLLWGTNGHHAVLHDSLRQELSGYIFLKAGQLGINISIMNIQPDHIHILLQLPASTSVSKVAKDLKGSTSKWISSLGNGCAHFTWQRGYGAFSVSSSVVEVVRRYIRNQTIYHQRLSFQEEYTIWASMYGAAAGEMKPAETGAVTQSG